MKRTIRLKWFYAYSPELIWECLTDREKLKQWSNLHRSADFCAEVGFKWMEEQKPRKGWDGKMYFEVLEVIPYHKLVYSFRGGPNPDNLTLNTIVTWTLVPKDQGTELHLEHSGFQGIQGFITSLIMEKGWGKHFAKKLMHYLNTHAHEHRQL